MGRLKWVGIVARIGLIYSLQHTKYRLIAQQFRMIMPLRPAMPRIYKSFVVQYVSTFLRRNELISYLRNLGSVVPRANLS